MLTLRRFTLTLLFWLLLPFCAFAANDHVTVGVLKYGTMNWEMDVIEQQQLASRYQVELERKPLGSPQALLVALQGGSVDIIVNDWLWASRQKEFGRDYYFFPYSTAGGVLITHPQANIKSLGDLRGKRVGIAGGTANKNWVLYKTFIQQSVGIDLATDVDIKHAAPPMLNALMEQGQLDAVINFWHYAAQLKHLGMPVLADMNDVLKHFAIDSEVPLLGWIFSKTWADANPDLVNRFLNMSYAARQQLKQNDDLWQSIPTFSKKYQGDVQRYLIDDYRNIIPAQFSNQFQASLVKLFTILKSNQSDASLTGNVTSLPDDIFWRGQVIAAPTK